MLLTFDQFQKCVDETCKVTVSNNERKKCPICGTIATIFYYDGGTMKCPNGHEFYEINRVKYIGKYGAGRATNVLSGDM